jgi:hypothetical protein
MDIIAILIGLTVLSWQLPPNYEGRLFDLLAGLFSILGLILLEARNVLLLTAEWTGREQSIDFNDKLLTSGAILIALSVIILLSAITIARWRSKGES